MKLHKLYNTLVIGGGVIAAGCAGNSQTGTTTTPTPGDKPTSTPAAKTTGDPAPSAKTTEPAADAKASPNTENTKKIPLLKPRSADAKCDECTGEGRGMMCPDPQVGGTNCCWLMSSPRHPCCP